MLYVALRDHVSTAKVLLKHGADINITDKSGGTPLHFAACEGSRKIARLLLAGGANVNAKDDEGRTPLDVATVEVADLLRQYRAKRRKTSKGRFPGSARWEGHAPCN